MSPRHHRCASTTIRRRPRGGSQHTGARGAEWREETPMHRRPSWSRRARLATAAAALALPLALAACGGGGNTSSGGSSASVKSLRVLDYYNNEPDKSFWSNVLNACGKANGVTINRETVP